MSERQLMLDFGPDDSEAVFTVTADRNAVHVLEGRLFFIDGDAFVKSAGVVFNKTDGWFSTADEAFRNKIETVQVERNDLVQRLMDARKAQASRDCQ